MSKLRRTLLAAAAWAALPCLSYAQGVAQLGEVIVTAEKRAANLQSVPMVVTAVTAERLENSVVDDARDLTAVTPGLVFTKSLMNGQPFIRGVGQTLGDISAESPTAIYVDGVYLMHPASGLFGLGSIDQIEVLRGPQGTLYGRNAVGGLIHLITKSPASDKAEGSVELGYGNYSTVTAKAYGSAPLNDDLAVNLSLAYANRDKGPIRTLSSLRLGDYENFSGLNKWVWTPSEATRITLSLIADYSEDDTGTRVATPQGSRPNGSGVGYLGFWTVPAQNPQRSSRSNGIAALTLEHDFGAARFKNILAYNRLDSHAYIEALTPGLGIAPLTPAFGDVQESGDTISNELQIQAPADADFQWIAGLYLLKDVARDYRSTFATLAGLRAGTPVAKSWARQETSSYAVFAQGSKTVLPDTRLTLGVRYTQDDKEVVGVAPLGAFSTYVAGLTAVNGKPKADWSKATWRVSLDHQFNENIMGYVAASEGFKSGVYNLGTFNNPSVAPETVRLYEIGMKSELFDRRVRLNGSYFYQDYSNIQLRSGTMLICGPGGCAPGALLTNAATSTMQGVDLDFEALLGSNLTVTWGMEYLDAQFDRFPVAPCLTPRPAPAGGTVTTNCDLSGSRLPRSPRLSANLGLTYLLNLSGGGKVVFTGVDAYNSGFNWDPDGRLKQKAYHLLNASVTWNSAKETWMARLWARNLLNEKIMANAAGGGSDIYYPDEPATYGVTVGRTF